MASSLLIAVVATVMTGAAVSAYVWLAQRARLERAAGIRIIAGMRWREFSRLVVDAMRERGFDFDPQQNLAERGQQADITLSRDGQPWLLSCKQGADYRITPAVVSKFGNAVHFHQAAGGTMVTPGGVSGEARGQAGAIELIDAAMLWPMLEPLLPDSVRDTVAAESRAQSMRNLAAGWMAALVIGAGVAWWMPDPTVPVSTPAVAAINRATVSPVAQPVATDAAPLTEQEQREQIRREVSDLPNINRAVWVTRSTLQVYLDNDSSQDPLRPICVVVERYDALRATRLQLQPAAGSQAPVRFLQCRLF